MRHLTIDVSNYDSRLHIGKQGENLTREITFDCAAWLDGLTGGVLSIVHQRPSDPDAYPCGDYVTNDTSLTWSINETDVAFSGLGKCELRYTIGSRIAKTKTFYTEIVTALNPLDTPPEAYGPYIDRVIDASRQEMETMTVSASAAAGEEASASVTKEITDHVNIGFDFVLPKGDKGDKGDGIPNEPSTDGSYVMSCERKDGASTISWSNHLSAIDNLLLVDKTLTFEYGSIANDGANGNNTRWLRTPGYLQFKDDKVRLTIKTISDCTLNVRVFRYDSTKTYVSRNHWSNQTIDIDVRSDYYYRFMIFSSNPGTYQLDIDDVNDYYALKEYVSMSDITPPDKTLSIDGRSADALAVRNLFEGDDSMLYHVIALKTDGTGDFTSLRSAVESISDASKSNPYMIEIYPGTYDVMDDFTDAEILAYADPSVRIGGIIIGDGINLRGVGNAKDIILNGYLPTTYDKDDIRNKVATITIGGNVSVENMTIVAENIRYCIHDSYSQGVGKYKRVMKDVVLIAHTLTSGNPERTYGCGMMSPGQDSYFENVDFGSDLVIHDNAVVSEPTVTIMKNCRGDQFNFNTKANYSVKHTLYMDGCSFASLRLPETDTLNSQNTLVYANGNPNIMVDALPGRVIMTQSVTKVKKNNLIVGTAVKMNNYTAEATTNFDAAFGIVVNQDSDYTYVQRCGYIFADYIGLTVSEGDYVTLDANGALTTTGATASNAVGVVIAYRNEMYIRMKWG